MALNDNRDSSMERLTPTLNELTRVLGELSDVVGDLQDVGKDFTKDVGKSVSALKDTSKAFEKENSTLDKTLQKHGAKFDGYAKAAVQSLSAVLSFAFNKFEKGFNSIVDNFNQNFTAITSRQQYTNRQYANMLNGFTKWVETHDLRTQFSQIDLSNALIPILQTGIRGGLAEEMAKRNVVTEKLLPMINTNTRAYMRMSKLFGDTFTQGITAIGTYTERYLQSAEGLEEGNLDSIIQTIYRELGEVAKTPEQFNKMMQETITSYQIMASKYGADYAGTALQNYSKWISGEGVMSGDLASILPGKSASNRSFDAFGKAMETIFSTYIDGRMPSGYGANAFGFSKEAIQDYMIGQKFNKEMTVSMDEVLADFDASAEYQKDMYTLSQGAYNSITEQQNKFNENAMAYLGTLAAENIPDVQGSLNLIKGIVSAFFTAWLTSRTIDKVTGGGDGGILGSLIGKNNIVKGGNFRLLKSFANAGAASGHWGTSVVGNTVGGALQTLGPIAGGLIAVKDAISGGLADPTKSGIALRLGVGGVGGRVINTIGGAIAGNTEADSTWGVAKNIMGNTAKGALIGAVGGPVGMLIGGAIGAITNVIATDWKKVSFLKEQKALNEQIKATKKAFSSLDESTNNLINSSKNYKTVTDILSSSVSNEAKLRQLKTEVTDPELQKLLENVTTYDELVQLFGKNPYELIKEIAENTRREDANKWMEDVANAVGENSDLLSKASNTDYALAGATQKFASIVSSENTYHSAGETTKALEKAKEQYERDTGKQISLEDFAMNMNQYWKKKTGASHDIARVLKDDAGNVKIATTSYSKSDAKNEGLWGDYTAYKTVSMWDPTTGEYTSTLKKGEMDAVDTQGNYYWWKGDRFKQLYDKYGLSGEVSGYRSGNEVLNTLEEDVARMVYSVTSVLPYYEDVNDPQHQEILDSATSMLKSIKQTSDWLTKQNVRAKGSTITNLAILRKYPGWDAYGIDINQYLPQYKKGLWSVLRDGYKAVLHAGEMVLPASASEDLRELSGAHSIEGVSSFLKSLLGLSKATPTASALPDTSTVEILTSAIEAQTRALSKILNSILDRVSNIDGMMDGQLRRNLNQGNVPEMARSWFGFPLPEN